MKVSHYQFIIQADYINLHTPKYFPLMIYSFQQPHFSPATYNLFEIINFRTYEYLPRWNQSDADPMFLTNINRMMNVVAWHSRFKTVFPHSLQYLALRSITLDDPDALLKILRNPKFNINDPIQTKYGLTALQYASMKNKFPILELLLMHGANINKPDSEGNTPLMMAVMNQSLQSINSLLKNGCDRDLRNMYGKSAADKAIQQQNEYIAQFIKKHPSMKRSFPKFRIELDIQKKMKSPIESFLSGYRIYEGKVAKSPFNDFKGNYRIVLNNFKTVDELLKEKQRK